MITAIIAIHILVSIVLIGSVLLQVGKGASIGSTFGGASSQTIFGSAGPATFLTKITAACALIFMVTSLYLTFASRHERTSSIMRGTPAVIAPAAEEQAAPEAKDAISPAPAMEQKTAPPAATAAPIKNSTPSKNTEPVK